MGLVNHWIFSDEYIRLDVSKIDHEPVILSTIDIERKTGLVRQFFVASSWSYRVGSATLALKYEEDLNCELFAGPQFHELWGTATIEIDIKDLSAKASWVGSHIDKWNGVAEVTVIRAGLTQEKKRVAVSKLERRQQRLRNALLALDKRCAITGESTPEVLDAAHVIAASKGGREVIENALLLRADLHRLLDAGMIEIDSSGQVVQKVKLPRRYADLLSEKRLPADVISRVAGAIRIASA